jgi:hypothetical protein
MIPIMSMTIPSFLNGLHGDEQPHRRHPSQPHAALDPHEGYRLKRGGMRALTMATVTTNKKST